MTTIKYTLALDGRRSIILYTTTNQKHAETANEGTNRRWDWGGAWGVWNTIVSGAIVQLARVEAMALEVRIEMIQDQVRRIEGEQDSMGGGA